MYLSNIALTNFRNFRKKEIGFSDATTVVIGDNATGKTNVLEAVNFLATGKSFKAKLEKEVINYDKDVARISGRVGVDHSKIDLEIVITDGEVQIGEAEDQVRKTQRKKLLVNGLPKRLVDFSGNLKVVLFGPWDLELVTEAPSVRRRFLDTVLSQVDREYGRGVLLYVKGVRQRNKLLFRIRDEGLPRSQLLYWDRLLIKHGNYITDKRSEFIDFVNETEDFRDRDYSLSYDSSEISEQRLEKYSQEELYAGKTLVGPHRDDMQFQIKNYKLKVGRDLDRYGSRGEQRMGILWLKLAELAFIEKVTGDKPILLLDDIFSELDHEHREIVFDVTKNQQTIITTADPHYIETLGKVEKIELGL